MGVSIKVPETIYDSVLFQNRLGSLSLSDDQLCHHTPEKVAVLDWKKVVKRQVSTSASTVTRPMFKLILKSGNEAIFQMEDRVSLEVLRDDLGERIKNYRLNHPEEFQEENRAVNRTRHSFSGRHSSLSSSSSTTTYSSTSSQKEYIGTNDPIRRDSTGGPAFRRNYSGERKSPYNNKNNKSRSSTSSTSNESSRSCR